MEENIQNNVVEETNAESAAAERTFSAEEVAKLIQAEADKRVSQALKSQEKKHQKELSLSKLDGDARERAEKDARIQELEEKLASFEREKNKSEIKSVLSSRGLSAEFADIINITNDLEESQSNIDTFDKLFKKAVQAEVEKRLAAGSVPKGNSVNTDALTKESFRKMSIAEQTALYNTNPELYQRMVG